MTVTNQRDKEMQLPKILAMDQMVIDIMSKRDVNTSRPTSAAGSAAAAVRAAAAPPASSAKGAEAVDGLVALLDRCNLRDKLALATAWCEEMGVDSVTMLRDDVDDEDRDAFAAALDIKELKRKQLLKHIKQSGDA